MKPALLALLVLIFTAILSTTTSAASCSLDVFGLSVEGNSISGTIKNTGDTPVNVEYQMFVFADRDGRGSFVLSPRESKTVHNDFTFEPGDYEIRLEAASSCGAFDDETIHHTVLEEFACFNPPGLEGQNYCNYFSQKYQVCEQGAWRTIAQNAGDYCINCGFTCGDSVCNCGEDFSTCRQDCSCTEGFINDFQCSGNVEQQAFQHSDCSTEWVLRKTCSLGCDTGGDRCAGVCREGFEPVSVCDGNVRMQKFVSSDCSETFVAQEFCDFGCQSGLCLSESAEQACDVTLENVDFMTDLKKGDIGSASATIHNGNVAGRVTLTFNIDGTQRDSHTIDMHSRGDARRIFSYSPSTGTHRAEIVATHSCGAQDSQFFPITVTGQETVTVQPPAPTAEPREQTSVTILPPTIDIPIYGAKSISVTIETAVPQNFRIDVSGLPSGFASFEQRIIVDHKIVKYIFITPTQSGRYHFAVTVTAEKEDLAFTKEIDLFAIPPFSLSGDESEKDPFDISSFLSPTLALIGIAAAALIIGGVAYRRRRQERLWNSLYHKIGWQGTRSERLRVATPQPHGISRPVKKFFWRISPSRRPKGVSLSPSLHYS